MAQRSLRFRREFLLEPVSVPIKDSLIASTALVHGLTVATRNVRDFRMTGVHVVNPFDQ
jgi:predicted nucleic acid-binding protein